MLSRIVTQMLRSGETVHECVSGFNDGSFRGIQLGRAGKSLHFPACLKGSLFRRMGDKI